MGDLVEGTAIRLTRAVGPVLLLAGCLSTNQEPPTTVFEPAWRIVEVIDGDTVVVEGDEGAATVRLEGVNAPERDECGADDARRWLNSLAGEAVHLEVTGRDQFDRVLAHLHSDDGHVNRELVSLGLAIATTPDDGDPYGTELIAAEWEAYQSALGLWSRGACGSEGAPPAVEIDQEASSPDPAGGDEEVLGSEGVVIVNRSTSPVDLSGWILRDESSRHRYRFAHGTALPAGGSKVVSSADPGWSPGGSPVWNNQGDLVLLQEPDGTVVSRWRY